jgi:hypothetical protein
MFAICFSLFSLALSAYIPYMGAARGISSPAAGPAAKN